MNNNSYTALWALIAAAIVVYIVGLSIDIMDIDAAQYASISLEMLKRHDFLTVTERGANYLDKPPLTFWLSALSYKIFGVNTVAYKLPSVLFSLLALFSTYKLARAFYSKEIALLSVVITSTCLAFFMINNDCRTDTILTGATLFALYQLVFYIRTKKFLYLFGAFVAVGLAMLSKGPIGLVMPFAIIGLDLLVKKDWKSIFSFRWFWGLPIVALILTPMCIGLYRQFGSEGLYFFFWKQSFGRFTGENEFVKQLTPQEYVNDPFFFYHTFLWLFAPWAILFVVGFVVEIKNFIQKKAKLQPDEEMITWAGFILIFTAMSMSMYKLPHYIIMALPLAGIVTAKFLVLHLKGKLYRWLLGLHVFLMFLLWVVCFYLVGVSFPSNNTFSLILIVVFFGITVFVFYKSVGVQRLVYLLSLTIVFGYFMMNYHVYPRLLAYQTSGTYGRYIHDHQLPVARVHNFTDRDNALDFYAQNVIPHYDPTKQNITASLQPGHYVIASKALIDVIDKRGVAYKILLAKDNYRVTLLTPEFLNPATRPDVLNKRYLIEVL